MVRSQSRWSLLAWSAALLCVTEFAFAEQSAAERRGLIFVASTAHNVMPLAKSVRARLPMLPHFAHCVSDIQLQTCSDLCLRESIRRCRDFNLRLVKSWMSWRISKRLNTRSRSRGCRRPYDALTECALDESLARPLKAHFSNREMLPPAIWPCSGPSLKST